jgi:hypothetical protein
MNVKEAWENFVLERAADFIDGEVEHKETIDGIFRGPIVNIEIKDDTVFITTEWTARMPVGAKGRPSGEWSKVEHEGAERFAYSLKRNELWAPRYIDEGCVYFENAFARVTLFPKGGSKLSRDQVRGL